MAVSSVETGPRIFMDPDNKDITPEQSRRHVIEERKRLYQEGRGVNVPVSDLSDEEYAQVTGYNIVNQPEAVPAPIQAVESTKSPIEKIREYLSHFGRPNTPNRQPV
jgi:hypothetical protein